MNKTYSVLLAIFFTPAALALSPLAQRLQTTGATCTATAQGDYCIFRSAPKYNQPVIMLIPPNLNQPKSLILYLHGHRGVCGVTNSTVPANMATRYKLLNQMLTAGLANSVTIFPMSRGNCTDYDNSLVANFPAFAEWADQQLNPSTNTWMISGHSGAGRALANIAATFKDFTKRVEISTLLDAAYSMGSYIGRWQVGAGSNRRMKIRSFYATSSPEAGSIQLQNTIPAQAKAVRSKSYGDHCNVPMTDFGDALKDSSAANLDIAADSVSF